MKLREYMAMGKPIVTSRLRNFAETVEKNQCGIVVDDGPEAFGHALADLILDQARAKSLGENGRKAVAHGNDWTTVAGRIIQVLSTEDPAISLERAHQKTSAV